MTEEVLLPQPDPAKWVTLERAGGLRFNVLWENPETGASISILEAPAGSGVPTTHIHASNQFMYCLTGEYEYVDSGLVLRPGSFYMNPKGHPHGPTRAREDSVLIEIYDGPHYFEVPEFHTRDTVGKIAGKQ